MERVKGYLPAVFLLLKQSAGVPQAEERGPNRINSLRHRCPTSFGALPAQTAGKLSLVTAYIQRPQPDLGTEINQSLAFSVRNHLLLSEEIRARTSACSKHKDSVCLINICYISFSQSVSYACFITNVAVDAYKTRLESRMQLQRTLQRLQRIAKCTCFRLDGSRARFNCVNPFLTLSAQFPPESCSPAAFR